MRKVVKAVIGRSVGEVFAYVTDPGRLPEWRTGVNEAGWIDGNGAGPLGRRGRLVRDFMGASLELFYEVTEYAPDELFTIRVETGPIAPTTRMVFRPEGTGTRVESTVRFNAQKGFSAMVPVVSAAARRDEVADFAALKRILEGPGR